MAPRRGSAGWPWAGKNAGRPALASGRKGRARKKAREKKRFFKRKPKGGFGESHARNAAGLPKERRKSPLGPKKQRAPQCQPILAKGPPIWGRPKRARQGMPQRRPLWRKPIFQKAAGVQMDIIDSKGHISREFLSKMDTLSLFAEERNVVSEHIAFCPYCADAYSRAAAKNSLVKAPPSLSGTIRDLAKAKFEFMDSLTRACSISVGVLATGVLLFAAPALLGPAKRAVDWAGQALEGAGEAVASFERGASEFLDQIEIGGIYKSND
jgi:hypothetical protein